MNKWLRFTNNILSTGFILFTVVLLPLCSPNFSSLLKHYYISLQTESWIFVSCSLSNTSSPLMLFPYRSSISLDVPFWHSCSLVDLCYRVCITLKKHTFHFLPIPILWTEKKEVGKKKISSHTSEHQFNPKKIKTEILKTKNHVTRDKGYFSFFDMYITKGNLNIFI